MDSLYRGVVTADAFSSFEINITQNRVISAVCRNPDVFYPVEGVPVPGPLDANTRYWAGRVMSDNRDDFIRMMDRENLLVMYEVGERSPWIEYMVYDLNGNEVYLRESLSLTKDEDSGDIVGIIIMRDITEQNTRRSSSSIMPGSTISTTSPSILWTSTATHMTFTGEILISRGATATASGRPTPSRSGSLRRRAFFRRTASIFCGKCRQTRYGGS